MSADAIMGSVYSGIGIASLGIPVMAAGGLLKQMNRLGSTSAPRKRLVHRKKVHHRKVTHRKRRRK